MKENPWARLLAYVTGRINQDLLVKNEYLAPRIAFCGPNCPLACGYPIRKDPRLLILGSASGAKRWQKSPTLPSLTPFWLGIAGSSRRNSMDPNSAATPADRRSNRNWRS